MRVKGLIHRCLCVWETVCAHPCSAYANMLQAIKHSEMDKKAKLISLLLFFGLIICKEVKSQTFCFTPTNSENLEFDFASATINVAESYCLRIYVHVIRRSDGTGGQSVSEVNEALNFLDIDFNSHNIYFHWDGVIDYIDSNSYYSSPKCYNLFCKQS